MSVVFDDVLAWLLLAAPDSFRRRLFFFAAVWCCVGSKGPPAVGEILINSLFIATGLSVVALCERLFYGSVGEPRPGIWRGIIAFAAGSGNLVG